MQGVNGMISRADAHKLSMFDCENRTVDELLKGIEKYIYQYATQKKIRLLYAVDGTKYTPQTLKKAIKQLRKLKYKVKVVRKKDNGINTPRITEILIKWW